MPRLSYKFEEEKAAQAVAFLIRRAGAKPLTKGVLVKMLYVADCRQLSRIGSPITGDKPTAMENGPVLSHLLNRFNGTETTPFWSSHFSVADEAHVVSVKEPLSDDLLSEAEKKSLIFAFDSLKNYRWVDLVNKLHERKEWIKHNAGKSSRPIPFESILEAEGRDEKYIALLKSQQTEHDLVSRMFA